MLRSSQLLWPIIWLRFWKRYLLLINKILNLVEQYHTILFCISSLFMIFIELILITLFCHSQCEGWLSCRLRWWNQQFCFNQSICEFINIIMYRCEFPSRTSHLCQYFELHLLLLFVILLIPLWLLFALHETIPFYINDEIMKLIVNTLKMHFASLTGLCSHFDVYHVYTIMLEKCVFCESFNHIDRFNFKL